MMLKQRAPLHNFSQKVLFLSETFGEIGLKKWLQSINNAKSRNADLSDVITTTMGPTGSSPSTLRSIIQANGPWAQQARKALQGVGFFGMDDYCRGIGEQLQILPIEDPRSYAAEHTRELLDPANVAHNLRFLFQPSADPSTELERLESIITGRSGGRIDSLLCSLGKFDAHVAFHLPGVPFDRGAHIGQTTNDIKTQNAKHCGDLGVPETFVTHGAATFMNAGEVIILADHRKQKILQKSLEAQGQTTDLPITSVLFNPEQKVTIVADRKLGTALKKQKRLIPDNVRVLVAAPG